MSRHGRLEAYPAVVLIGQRSLALGPATLANPAMWWVASPMKIGESYVGRQSEDEEPVRGPCIKHKRPSQTSD